jgi:NADH-quinone oxidoreductase subunit E
MDIQTLDKIIDEHRYEEHALISILQDIQSELNWLPKESLKHISKRLDIPLSRIYSIATFFKAFSLKPRGKHMIIVCLGTACHVRGAPRIVEALSRHLKIKPGETTPDMQFSMETVNCVGACAMGPIMIIDNTYYGQMTIGKVASILRRYSK